MWGILLRIAVGALIATAGVIVIKGIIDMNKVKTEMRNKNITDAIITMVDKCENKIKIEDLYSDEAIEIEGDDISDEIEEGNVISI